MISPLRSNSMKYFDASERALSAVPRHVLHRVTPMDFARIYERYQELQRYVGWTDEDAARVASVAGLAEPSFVVLVEDFYEEIERHPAARQVIKTPEQLERLKATLVNWLRELFSGRYDREYVTRRWRVGWRHVEIGLDQVFTNVALSRLRRGLLRTLAENWKGDIHVILEARQSLNSLIDLDLAIIEDAYQTEHLERQARNARLATIGQVAGGIAHELRNPLNTLKTSAYFLRNVKNASPEKVNEHLERIERQVAIADRVITALTEFARQPLPTLSPAPLVECVQEALTANPSPENVRVRVDCTAELPPIMADRDQLSIVLANLFRNAYDAMPDGGELTVTGRPTEAAVELVVTDTGVGIPPENLARIMDPLFSTKTRGIGLGLAITRAILDKHGATVKVQSQLGQGTTFVVTFVRGPHADSANTSFS
jgi:signal transduction histidine kinase